MDLPLQLCSLAQLRDEWKALERMYCTTNWWVTYDDDDDMVLNAEQCQIHLESETRVAIYFKPKSFSDSVAIGFVKATDQGTSWIPAAIKIDAVGRRMEWRDRVNGISTWPIQMVNHCAGSLGTILMKSLPLIHFLLRCNLQEPWQQFELIQKMGLLGIDENWWRVLCNEFTKPYFKTLCHFIVMERRLYPNNIHPREINTFAWTRYCRPQDVKVVIVGQDPYPFQKKNTATGVAFDIPRNEKLSSSLTAIFNALEKDSKRNRFDFRKPDHGSLIAWARRGVLLLNAALTVREGAPQSHAENWKEFTDMVIKYISCNSTGVVFLLWGKMCTWWKENFVDCSHVLAGWSGNEQQKHLVLKCYHPTRHWCCCPKMKRNYLLTAPSAMALLPHEVVPNAYVLYSCASVRWSHSLHCTGIGISLATKCRPSGSTREFCAFF